jgi:hypothetical protein
VAKNDSAAALSQHTPVRPALVLIWLSAQKRANSLEVYYPFFTNTDLPTAQADIVHGRHAIIETVFADLIDGPLAHLPSGHFGANSAWALCAAIARNLLHTAGTIAGQGTPSPGARPCADN